MVHYGNLRRRVRVKKEGVNVSALVERYVREVSSGNMKIEDVPAGLREKVKAGVEAKKNGVA